MKKYFMVTFPDQITDIMLDAKDFLSSKVDSIAKKIPKWEERQATLNESWADSGSALYENLLKCSFATCLEEPAVMRCNGCSATKYLCGPCDQYVHERASLHDRDGIVNGHYQPIPPTLSKNSSGKMGKKGSFPWNENSTDTGMALARTYKFWY